MNLPVQFNGAVRQATVSYAVKPDFGFLREWRAALGEDRHPVRTDAVDLATLACKRFKAHFSLECYAQRVEDIAAHVRNNPNCEVANLVMLKCDWFPTSEVIGLAHFRRSWCNNLILDYLTAHPWIADRPGGCPDVVRGVGTALLCFLSDVGTKYDCGAIWGEATQNSRETYEKFFGLEHVQDLLYIPQSKFVEFAERIKEKWASKTLA